MRAEIVIGYPGAKHYFKTNDYYGIYDFVSWLGLGHSIAEDVASWAENAPVGAEYYGLAEGYFAEIVGEKE